MISVEKSYSGQIRRLVQRLVRATLGTATAMAALTLLGACATAAPDGAAQSASPGPSGITVYGTADVGIGRSRGAGQGR